MKCLIEIDFHMKQMELTLTKEDAAHWVYRGEGAVNLVLAYSGSSPSYVSFFFFLTCNHVYNYKQFHLN